MAYDGGGFFSDQMAFALKGELTDYLDAADEVILKAARFAVQSVVATTKDRLRDMVRTAGLGDRVGNSIRGEVYPKSGLANNPSGWIYVRGATVKIFEAFESGVDINAPAGKALAIPIPGSPADKKNFGQARSGETVIETLRARGIKLKFVPGKPGRAAMLVGENVRVRATTGKGPARQRVGSAKLTKSGGYAKGAQDVPLFWLVRHADMPDRLDWDAEYRRAVDSFVSEFAREFEKWLGLMRQAQAERAG